LNAVADNYIIRLKAKDISVDVDVVICFVFRFNFLQPEIPSQDKAKGGLHGLVS